VEKDLSHVLKRHRPGSEGGVGEADEDRQPNPPAEKGLQRIGPEWPTEQAGVGQ
jgi:hypothetical protein